MDSNIKGALIIAVAILIATAGWIYFSPYQSCMRDMTRATLESRDDEDDEEIGLRTHQFFNITCTGGGR